MADVFMLGHRQTLKRCIGVASIPRVLFAVLVVFVIAGCVFIPKSSVVTSECEMYTPKWELSVEILTEHNMCEGSGANVEGCLLVTGVVLPLGSMIVSGSIVLVGNSIHWIEYHGRCDEGAIKKILSNLENSINSHQIISEIE